MPPPRSSTPNPSPEVSRRRVLMIAGAGALAFAVSLTRRSLTRFPPDTSPAGAYLRLAVNIDDGRPRECFAYLEDQAQHAAYSIRDYRKQASEKVAASYPEP